MTRFTRRSVLQLAGASAVASAVPFRVFGQSKTPLKWMTWGGTANVEKIINTVATQVPAIGNAYDVTAIDGGPGDQEVAAALRLALASGQNLPDIVQLNRTQLTEFAMSGAVLSFDDFFADLKDDVYSGALEVAKVDDHFAAVPLSINSKLFYYRTDLFEKAGIDIASLGTVDGFLAAGQAMKEKGGSSILNLGPQPATYWLAELISAYPGSRYFADKDGTYTLTTNPAFKESFSFLKTLYDSGLTAKIDDWSSDWQPAIANGQVASFLGANWLKVFLPNFAPDLAGKWGVSLWPSLAPLADQRHGTESGGAVYVVPKDAPNASAAVDYLRKVYFEKEGALAMSMALGQTPLIKSAKDEFLARAANPVKPDGMSDKDFALNPDNYFGSTLAPTEIGSFDYATVLQYDPAASKGLDIISQWLQKAVGGMDVDQALQSAQADMESQIGNPFNA